MKRTTDSSMKILVLVLILSMFIWAAQPRAQVNKPTQSWVIYDQAGDKVVKIQDGPCSFYVYSGFHAGGITTGQGCK